MAISRKRWNNIIIICAIMMIAVLNLLDQKTADVPDDAYALFDQEAPLAQLQLNKAWLHITADKQQCAPMVLNCETWIRAWQNVQVSPLTQQPEAAKAETPKTLVIQVQDRPQAIQWNLYENQGLLESQSGNWYQIPPSLRADLKPIRRAQQK